MGVTAVLVSTPEGAYTREHTGKGTGQSCLRTESQPRLAIFDSGKVIPLGTEASVRNNKDRGRGDHLKGPCLLIF